MTITMRHYSLLVTLLCFGTATASPVELPAPGLGSGAGHLVQHRKAGLGPGGATKLQPRSGPVHIALQRQTVERDPAARKRGWNQRRALYGQDNMHARQESPTMASNPPTVETVTAGMTNIPVENLMYDVMYTANLSLGTPPQEFTVSLDTGSGPLWVMVAGCGGDSSCGPTVAKYYPNQSSTFEALESHIDLHYGKGDASGYLMQDTASMGGWGVPSQQFIGINYLLDMPAKALAGVSGLVGLSPTSYRNQTNFLVEVAQGWLDQQFGFYAGRSAYVPNASDEDQYASREPNSQITFGGVDSTKFQGELNYIPTLVSYDWLIPFEGYTMGNTQKLYSGAMAAIDTGTTRIYGPKAAVAAFYANIPSAAELPGYKGYYYMKCSDVPKTLSFRFGGQDYPMYGPDIFYEYDFVDGISYCLGSVIGDGSTESIFNDTVSWLMGDAMLKNVYTAFRLSPLSVGFAPLVAEADIRTTVSATRPTSAAATTTRTPTAIGPTFNAGIATIKPSTGTTKAGSSTPSLASAGGRTRSSGTLGACGVPVFMTVIVLLFA